MIFEFFNPYPGFISIQKNNDYEKPVRVTEKMGGKYQIETDF